jgi:phosphotransferase system enzyme I (PtsI)
VCGEAAASPALAPVLVGLGVTSLSMSASAVADVRDALAAVTLAECRELAGDALSGKRSPHWTASCHETRQHPQAAAERTRS